LPFAKAKAGAKVQPNAPEYYISVVTIPFVSSIKKTWQKREEEHLQTIGN
jgi:hypothetical protein